MPAALLAARWMAGRVAALSMAGPVAALLMPGPVAGQVPEWSLQARQRLQAAADPASSSGLLQQRQALLDDGERALAEGDAAAAQASFERAAGMLHAPDTEAAQVRALMQAGDYRRALAFGAHAAGAHRRDWPAGSALYAWLLQAGGQAGAARHYLAEALDIAPNDPALQAARQALHSPWPRPVTGLRQAPLRLAPWSWGAALPDNAEVIGSALLLDGDRALASTRLLDSAGSAGARIWLRNGLGQTVAASPGDRDDGLGIVVLRLATPLPAAGLLAALREPFAGSPAYLVEYNIDSAALPAWPMLRQGFFARQAPALAPRPLGIAVPPGPRGGPVFDAAGQWVGLALRDAAGQDLLLPVSVLLQRFGHWVSTEAPRPAQARPEVDLIYERLLRSRLQLLVQVPAPP